MPLTDVQIRNAKPQDTPYKLADGGGLHLYITPKGGKLWRLKYRIHGKEKLLSIGGYPEVSAAEARKRREEAKALLKEGVDPSQQKKQEKLAGKERADNNFEAVAREWHQIYLPTWASSTANRNLRLLELNAFPWIGSRPIAEITPPELLQVLRLAEKRGVLETAHRVRTIAGMVFRYGVATGRCTHDISASLKGALAPAQETNYPAIIEPERFASLLRDIWAYQGSFITGVALKLSALLGQRPGEIRALEWSEIDTGNAIISIDKEKMKKRRDHLIPLSTQVLTLLEEIRLLTGHGKYVFPGQHAHDRPLSENTVNAALRRLGYDTKTEHCAHGFRSSFSSLANESKRFRWEVIEIQLAHRHGNGIKMIYDRATYLEERRELMQWWSDECDRLRLGRDVTTD